jgi:hypothetical protein
VQSSANEKLIMDRPEKILLLKNEIEAMLLDEILNEKQIPHLIRSYHDSVYDGLWQTQSGWGHIEAPGEYAEEIISIYNHMSETPSE